MSTDLKYTILALGGSHSVSEIEALTAVSRRQIYRIRRTWETTGCVEPERVGKKAGRPRFLTKDEELVSTFPSIQGWVLIKCSCSMWSDVSKEHPISTSKTSNHKS